MSSKNAKRGISLKWRMVVGATLSAGFFSVVACVLILVVSWHYLMNRVYDRIDRMGADLQQEYVQFGGLTPGFRHCMEEDADENNVNTTFILLVSPTDECRFATRMPQRILERILRNVSQGFEDHRFYTERENPNDRHIAVRYRVHTLQDGSRVVVAKDVTDVERFLIFLLVTLCSTVFLVTVCTAAWALVASTRFVGRLRRIAEAAVAIEGGDWGRRVEDVSGSREMHDLMWAFNSMCDKNEKTLNELRVLTDNIAHDLRTPLARLSMAAETEATGGTLKEPLADLVAGETEAMLGMINTMLEISQTDAKIDRSPRTEVDLTDLLKGLVEFYEPLAEQSGLTLNLSVPATCVLFSGHRAKLQQLVGNLVENAIKYTPRGGRVDISLEGEGPVLRVADTGCGIAAADIPHVFKRFWRADTSRSLPGNGLGLALVKAIATSYGGRVDCTSEVGVGTTFTVSFAEW